MIPARNFSVLNTTGFDSVRSIILGIESAVHERECRVLYETARDVAVPGVIVEIGSYLGRSTCSLAFGAALSGRTVYAIDHHQGDEMSGTIPNQLEGFRHNITLAGVASRVVPVVNDSLQAARQWPPNRKIAVLFIDGLHTLKSCQADFKAFHRFLSDEAWVLFHDYGVYDGVRSVVDDLATAGIILPVGRIVRTLAVTRLAAV